MINRYWKFNTRTYKYEPSPYEALSLFPTIVSMKEKIVYCRKCHRWEYITGFSNNILTTQCGKKYEGPFTIQNTIFNYGYEVILVHGVYHIKVNSQTAALSNRRLIENRYDLDLNKKILYKNGASVFENEDLHTSLCPEITQQIIDELADNYKKKFGIKPTVSSKLTGFNLIIGYMLSPFNINFFKIAQHWGLNPYDKNFASLSSGDTPTAENEMFESLGIKPNKTIRKLYQKFPQSVICYSAAKDLGFTDVNLLQKTSSSHFYAFLKHYMISYAGGEISYLIREPLKQFVNDLLQITNNNQKAIWNSLERTIGYLSDSSIQNNVITDGINGYSYCREYLTEKEKKDIMHEGFNDFTHNFIVHKIDALRIDTRNHYTDRYILKENEIFEIPEKFKKLHYKSGDDKVAVRNSKGEIETIEVEDEDRYCFYVADCSDTLQKIGSEMHNCVGWGYISAVREKKCAIVYAKYKDKYKICIEVTPDFTIRQSLGPCNQPLQGEDLQAYQEWCKAKHILFRKAFGIHCAPI